MIDWLQDHPELLRSMTVTAIALSVVSLVVVPLLIVAIPSRYFVGDEAPPLRWQKAHPALRLTLRILRNGLGAALLLTGVAMLVLPGQGLLTILVGLGLVEFPGKRRVEIWCVRKRGVLRTLNWIRARAGRAPLAVDAPSGENG